MSRAPLHGFAYSERALTFLKPLQPKVRRQIVTKIQTLASEPHPHNCKVVQGFKNNDGTVLRIRSGVYRILYVVRDITIVILDIGHRKDVYRR